MSGRWQSVICSGVVLVAIVFAVEYVSHAQTAGRTASGPARPSSAAAAAMDPEREKIWNSPAMLRARAWLHDYCSKSAKVTPEMAQHYQTELQNMSAAQLKVWLLKFEHDEEQKQQQYAVWQQAHASALSQAVAAQQATQKAYASIEQGENAAAGQQQAQLNQQAQAAEGMQEAKQLETAGPNPAMGYYPGYGGIHYHYHLYPYAY